MLFDVRGFVFVLALDRDQVQTAIQDIYNSEGRKFVGSDYLKKLVQVEFDLPIMPVGQVGDYLNSLQRSSPGSFDDETGGVFKEIVPFLSEARTNPREIKRFINRVLLVRAAITGPGKQGAESGQVTHTTIELASFLGTQTNFPDLADRLAATPDLLDTLITYVQDGESAEEEVNSQVGELMIDNEGLEGFLRPGDGKRSPLLNLSKDNLAALMTYSRVVAVPGGTDPNREDRPKRDIKADAEEVTGRPVSASLTGALTLARRLAQERGDKTVDVEQLLTSVLQTSAGHPDAEEMLKRTGLETKRTLQTVHTYMSQNTGGLDSDPTLSPASVDALKKAKEAADERKNFDFVTLSALLLGLLQEIPNRLLVRLSNRPRQQLVESARQAFLGQPPSTA